MLLGTDKTSCFISFGSFQVDVCFIHQGGSNAEVGNTRPLAPDTAYLMFQTDLMNF